MAVATRKCLRVSRSTREPGSVGLVGIYSECVLMQYFELSRLWSEFFKHGDYSWQSKEERGTSKL